MTEQKKMKSSISSRLFQGVGKGILAGVISTFSSLKKPCFIPGGKEIYPDFKICIVYRL